MFDQKAYIKAWNIAHPERTKGYGKKYYLTHLEQEKKRNKKYALAHKEQKKEYRRVFYLAHCEQRKAVTKKWQLTHQEEVKEYEKAYQHSLRGRIVSRKHSAKRRQLGFIPLNNYFIGAEQHHIDKEQIIYIPVGLHKSVSHNIFKNRNMDKINSIAFKFLNNPANYGGIFGVKAEE